MLAPILMDLTPIAEWLNYNLASFDKAIMTFAHNIHESAMGGFFDFFFTKITTLGNGGIFFIILALIFLFFRKTRKTGFGIILALIFGMIMTNLCLKGLVARPRPYADEASIFYQWWLQIGHGVESEIYSFPSGHATASFAAMGAFFAFMNKKWSWLGFVLAGLIGFSRIYIYVHYPSDIIGGMVVGLVAASLSYMIVSLLYKAINKSDGRLPTFIREADLFHIKKHKA